MSLATTHTQKPMQLTPTSAEDSRFFSDSEETTAPDPPVMQLKDMVSLLPIDPAAGLAARNDFLIGKTIKGVLLHRRGGYFIKWNDEIADAVFVSKDCVVDCLGEEKKPGLVAIVKCTIESLGPGTAHWTKQHPFAKTIKVVTSYWRNQVKGGARGPSPVDSPTRSPFSSRSVSNRSPFSSCSESFSGRVQNGRGLWSNSRFPRRNRTMQECSAL